jgi:hypothetical protein
MALPASASSGDSEAQVRNMAVLEKVHEGIQCGICYKIFHDCTALLPCLHSMCAGCIARWLSKKDTCPSCRLPVEDVRPNIVINGIIEGVLSVDPSHKREVRARLPETTGLFLLRAPKSVSAVRTGGVALTHQYRTAGRRYHEARRSSCRAPNARGSNQAAALRPSAKGR